MSAISSVTTPIFNETASSGPGDNGSMVVGGVDFNDVLNQLYAVEDECNKAIGELTQKVELLAKNSDGPVPSALNSTNAPNAPLTPAAPTSVPLLLTDPSTTDASLTDASTTDSSTTSSLNLQQLAANTDSTTAPLASFMQASQSYIKAQVLPNLTASMIFATES